MMRSCWPAVSLGALLLGTACGPRVLIDDDDAAEDGGTTTTTSADSTVTVTTTPEPPEPPEPPPSSGYCTEQCERIEDCCHGAPDCGEYPNNWTCENGACVYGGCRNDEDCASEGWVDDPLCADTSFGNLCLPSCDSTNDCRDLGDWECRRPLTGDRGFCFPALTCPDDGDHCEGWGFCDPEFGGCRCRSDGDCSMAPGYVCHIG